MKRRSSPAQRVFACLVATTVSGVVFGAQEVTVGYIEGGGAEVDTQQRALKAAKVEYKVIGKDDYKADVLGRFDVIGIGIVAFDQNPDLKANFKALHDYVSKGGYLVTLDFQQDSTWKAEYLPHPLKLFDDDLEDNVAVEVKAHPIWNTPHKIKADHFAGWGAGDFMADGPHDAAAPWKPLLVANTWPIVVGAESGIGYVVFNSLQVLQSYGRVANPKVKEVLENYLFWRGPALSVGLRGRLATTWARMKR